MVKNIAYFFERGMSFLTVLLVEVKHAESVCMI